jgi:hypothetical protein
MPSVNSTILEADYNSIRNKLVNVLGTGSGNTGWGQVSSIVSSAVSPSSRVTINEWANLRLDIINAHKHIYGSNPTTAQVSEGQTIRYTNNFTPDTGTLDVPQRQYDVWADTITSNRFTVAAGESATSSSQSTSRTGSWITQSSCVITFSFPTANEARYFFNSGGQIRVSSSRSGGVTSSQNTSWTSLLSTAGTQNFGGNNPGTGTSPSNGLNWYRVTDTFQTYYTATSSSPYGSNNWQLQARCTGGVTNNSTGTALSGEIRVLWNDGYVDPATAPHTPSTIPPEDFVDGTLTANVSYLYATGIMVPTSALFVVTQPTVAIGAISAT